MVRIEPGMEEWKSGMSTVISRIILNAHVHVQANEDQLG